MISWSAVARDFHGLVAGLGGSGLYCWERTADFASVTCLVYCSVLEVGRVHFGAELIDEAADFLADAAEADLVAEKADDRRRGGDIGVDFCVVRI